MNTEKDYMHTWVETAGKFLKDCTKAEVEREGDYLAQLAAAQTEIAEALGRHGVAESETEKLKAAINVKQANEKIKGLKI